MYRSHSPEGYLVSEPIARRKSLVDYRITTSKCQVCNSVYFPPKSFCNNEGRASKMLSVDYFYEQGEFYAGSIIKTPTSQFKYLDSYLSSVIKFDNFKLPGRITDFTPESTEDVSKLIGRPVSPRFRKNPMYSKRLKENNEDKKVKICVGNFIFFGGLLYSQFLLLPLVFLFLLQCDQYIDFQ